MPVPVPENVSSVLEAAAEKLESSERILRRRVRNVASTDTEYSQALFDLAAGRKFDWTPNEWRVVLDRLDNCELTVREYVDAYRKRS